MNSKAEQNWNDGGRPTAAFPAAHRCTPGTGADTATSFDLFAAELAAKGPIVGIEQEYALFKGSRLLVSPRPWDGLAPGAGYGCVGMEELLAWEIVESHLERCLQAGFQICRVGAADVRGRWRFEIGPVDVVTGMGQLEAARSVLRRTAAEYGIETSFTAPGRDRRMSGGDGFR